MITSPSADELVGTDASKTVDEVAKPAKTVKPVKATRAVKTTKAKTVAAKTEPAATLEAPVEVTTAAPEEVKPAEVVAPKSIVRKPSPVAPSKSAPVGLKPVGFEPRVARPAETTSIFSRMGNKAAGARPTMPARPVVVERERVVKTVTGLLDMTRDGHGVLRIDYSEHDGDVYISSSQIRRFNLRPSDLVTGPAREPKENERYWGLLQVDEVNGTPVAEVGERIRFKNLTPVYPNEQIKLETGNEPESMRIIDMVAPIGKGQRSLVVSPPKAGKTSLLKDMATGIAANHPEIHLMAVLVGERPEEVTDIRRHIIQITNGKGETAASNFDEAAEDQVRVAELALERAKRLVEMGKDVLILLDSITRLARAYNLAMPTSGRTLSGGFDPAALFPPKKFFGAARNFEVPGSLTIIGTALIDTGSRMDDLIYEEFKGTGNQEIHLDRRLAERRIYPAIDVQRSGTRRDDLLIDPITYQSILTLHRMLDTLDKEERTSTLIEQLHRTTTNKEFLASLKSA
jgi:transcription termination factor Rho